RAFFMLRIALPNKGRLADEARALFAEAGLGVRALGERALTASLGGEFQALFVRAQDVAEFVADGAADAGVTGWDLVAESDRALETLLDLEFGRCRLVVASHEESGIMSLDDITDHRVATVFPRLARNYFESLGRPVSIVPVSGAAEVAPHLGIADVIVDLVSTGSTLKTNGLRELATVLESTARLVVASHEESGIMSLDDITDHRVATVFPRLTRNYFESLGRPVSIVPVSGAAEVAPHLGIADVIVDLVSTGSTLKTNGLRELGTVLESTARLVGPKQGGFAATVHDVTTAVPRSRESSLDDLVTALDSVVRGRGKRYLMANVPRAVLDRVTAVLPGLNGPTVIDIMNGHDMVAVHAVVPADGIYRTIAALKGLGAEGILVTRIERLLP
ncbi:MAG TPA: ATP phosphoribosyltransferase, partial [Gemmatimonadaceae bacterium]|nr:ATP phosphoribosyltransferase [Gemmatimonadaceae bacterium]